MTNGVQENLLLVVLVAQTLMLVAALVLVFGHGLWGWLYRTRLAPEARRARNALIDVLDGGHSVDSQIEVLKRLPLPLQIDLFMDLAPSLSGLQRTRLTAVATDMGVVDGARASCRSRFWWRRLQGARLLTLVGGGGEVVPDLFFDPSFEVRAQAAEWGAEHPEPEVIERLLDTLSDPQAFCRFTVQDSLLRLGHQGVDAIAERLERPGRGDMEVSACLRVAAGIVHPRFLMPALGLCSDPRAEVRALAAAVLGSLGGDEVTRILTEMLTDESPQVRAAACRSLGKLAHWPAVTIMSGLLRDHAWIVRREAALALRATGMPGLLMLRRSLKDADRFAADMAQQVLDLPDTLAGLVAYDAL